MILHRPLAKAIVDALQSIMGEGRQADKVIQFYLKNAAKWGGRDRKIFAETVYDMVRHYRRLLEASGLTWPGEDQPPQLNESALWQLLRNWCDLKEISARFEWPKEVIPPPVDFRSRWEQPSSRRMRCSLPDWLDEWASQEVGEDWDQIADRLNEPAPVFLRANRLKTTPEKLVQILRGEEIPVEALEGDALRLSERRNVFRTKAFQSGLFEMQDLHSQRIAPLLQPRPGERVIDACAGAGGKTLHLAALMENKGKIIALDVHEGKLAELKKRLRRAHVSIVEMRPITGTKIIKRLRESADAVLLDVPCSGLGVLRRNPDSKWKLTAERVAELRGLQQQILSQYSQMVRAGGRLVYATCSIAPSENQKQVQAFLGENVSKWELEEEIHCWPEPGGGDGFYGARLRRLNLSE